jgi:hypothetical protein
LRQAVRLRPQAAEANNNLGLVLADLGRFEQAEACYHEALRLNPGYAEAHTNLGCALKELNRVEEALACFDMALRLAPDSHSSRYNRGLTLLQAGQWEQGWRDYEYRWGRKGMPERPMAGPRWDGTSPAGKTILVWCEQGLGDAIQFVRYTSLLAERGARVVLECPRMLVRLFSTCPGIAQLVAEGEPLPSHDAQVPMMSLPGLLGTTVDNVPCRVPYLSAEPERVAAWRRRLPPNGKFRVGIVWQGNPRFGMDRWRSVPLERFAPLAAVEGVELVSLQKGPGIEQLKTLRGRLAMTELEGEWDAESGAFLDTVPVMKCMDLVLSVDTAAGHVAGALGVTVWLLLSQVSDWRWLRQRQETAWYPTMRLFRIRPLNTVLDRRGLMPSERRALPCPEAKRAIRAKNNNGVVGWCNGKRAGCRCGPFVPNTSCRSPVSMPGGGNSSNAVAPPHSWRCSWSSQSNRRRPAVSRLS